MARAERKGDSLKDETPGAGTPRASNSNSKAEEPNMRNSIPENKSSQDTAQIIPFKPSEVIESHGGRLVTTSLKVAEVFGKQHRDVLKRLQTIDCSGKFNERNFAPIEYTDARNRKKPAFEMTKDGFVFLVMGFTGKKAAQFKEAYIEAFNAMERILHPDTLTEGQKGHIVRSVKDVVAKTGKHFQTVYHGINEAFGVATYKDIPAARYPELCRHLGVAPLEGEWLPAPGQEGLADGVSLNDMLGVVAHMEWIDKAWDELGPALRGLGSPWAGRMHDHVRDGALFAGSLRRRHGAEMEGEKERISQTIKRADREIRHIA